MGNHMKRIFVLFALAVTFVMPSVAFAQETPGDAGTATALSIIALVLIVIFAVAVVAAVGLGIIGIGYAMSSGDEG